eukprot:SAG11_NODE_7707_length_1106_cov_9.844091_1_plen_297_part_01
MDFHLWLPAGRQSGERGDAGLEGGRQLDLPTDRLAAGHCAEATRAASGGYSGLPVLAELRVVQGTEGAELSDERAAERRPASMTSLSRDLESARPRRLVPRLFPNRAPPSGSVLGAMQVTRAGAANVPIVLPRAEGTAESEAAAWTKTVGAPRVAKHKFDFPERRSKFPHYDLAVARSDSGAPMKLCDVAVTAATAVLMSRLRKVKGKAARRQHVTFQCPAGVLTDVKQAFIFFLLIRERVGASAAPASLLWKLPWDSFALNAQRFAGFKMASLRRSGFSFPGNFDITGHAWRSGPA